VSTFTKLGGQYRDTCGKYRSHKRSGGGQTPARLSFDNRKQTLKHDPNYHDVTLDPSWLDFQVFAAWFYQHWSPGLHLDKDIEHKIQGAKFRVYGPKTCKFVTRKMNDFNRRFKPGRYLRGVTWHQGTNSFRAKLGNVSLGLFPCEFQAARAFIKAKRAEGYSLAEDVPELKTWFRKYVRICCAELEQQVKQKESEV